MTTLGFLTGWALRSSILILSGAFLLWALRVKDPSIRLAAWTAMLCGSVAIPALTVALPKFAVIRVAVRPVEVPAAVYQPAPASPNRAAGSQDASRGFDWVRGALMSAVTIYVLIAGALLLRLCAGMAMSLRLLRSSRAAGQATEGIEIRESDLIAAPVTLGIARPAIVLPGDWREWGGAKLEAVLAHERSHIRRRDPAVQLLSAIHRALLWHSPLSWFLHKRVVRTAEEASDDAAVEATRDRALYAAVLLEFMQRGTRGASWLGVPMARYGRADQRIDRILDATVLSRGVTRWSVVAILASGSPLAYVVAAAQAPANTPQLSYESGTDGYLMHRGTTDQDVTAFMDLGGIDLQEKSYELRKRMRNFILLHRHEKTYLIEDPDAVRRAWKELDDKNACRERVEAATPLPDELQQALATCKIGEAEIVAARQLKETRGPINKSQNVIEIIMDSRIWSVLDSSISTGVARQIE